MASSVTRRRVTAHPSAAVATEEDIDDLDDEALLGLAQLLDALGVPEDFQRAALPPLARHGRADQLFQWNIERLRQLRQHQDRHPAVAQFVGEHGLLGNTQRLGEFRLGHLLLFAQLGNARPEGFEIRSVLLLDHGLVSGRIFF